MAKKVSKYRATTSKANLDLNILAAKIAYKRPEMKATGEKVLAQVRAVASGSEKTSRYVDSLDLVAADPHKVTGIVDLRVIARDPAAFSIEYGHLSGKRQAEGPLRQGEERTGRHWVMGKYYMTQAAAMVKKGA